MNTIPPWLILVLVIGAMGAGLVGNRILTRRGVEDSGLGIKELVAPVTTLAVVLMAFVMAQSLGSYGRARENVGAEARIVNEMSESARRLDDQAVGSRIRGQLVCYARAVRHDEWGPMDIGERAPQVSDWADRFEDELAALKVDYDDAETGRLIDLDSDRAAARVARITESSPTNPPGLNWLMLGTVTAAVVGLGLFVSLSGKSIIPIALLGVLTLVLAGTLYMINDLDQPFRGLNKLQPTDLEHAEQRIQIKLDEETAQAPLCDENGEPV